MLSRQGLWDEAIVNYKRAIEKTPDYRKAHRNLGYALNRRGQFEEANTVLSTGIELPTSTLAHSASLLYERAYARAELKDYDGAITDISQVLFLQNSSLKARYLRARIHLYRGDAEEARRDAERVVERVPDHAGAMRILDQISG